LCCASTEKTEYLQLHTQTKTTDHPSKREKEKPMKKFRVSVLPLALLFIATATTAYAEQYPKATGYVNDFAHLLTREQGALLNDELIAFEKKMTIEIAVVTVPGLNNQSLEDYARGLAKEWGVGKSNQNNGVVFLIAPKERKMRIETASGARVILTDSRADQIRDSAVLPRFKAGDMTQGIIDGTHAIMQALDASSVPVASKSETTSIPQSASGETAPLIDSVEIMKLLACFLGGVAIIVLSDLFIRRKKARKYVLENRSAFVIQLAEADRMAKSPDVKDTRRELVQLKERFSLIDPFLNDANDTVGTKWIKTQAEFESMEKSLSHVVWDMKQEIAFANKARKEGPELIKKIPNMIEATEKRLAEGKSSPRAMTYLERARAQYSQAQSQQSEQSGMSMTDWAVSYMLLTEAQSNMANADSVHRQANVDHSSDHSSSGASSHSSSASSYSSPASDDPSPSYGFSGGAESSDSGGFSGGGGFDSGGSSDAGGGSSGSW
jgi:uncharacterized protein